jgi:Tetratricopeptide repeat
MPPPDAHDPEGLRATTPDSETPTVSQSGAADAREVPERIGPYRPLRMIGQGGMGIVYEAEQDAPVHRKVALKLIKWGMDSREVIARFERASGNPEDDEPTRGPSLAARASGGGRDPGSPGLGSRHARTLYSKVRLAATLSKLGRFAEAEQHASEAAATGRASLGEAHPEVVGAEDASPARARRLEPPNGGSASKVPQVLRHAYSYRQAVALGTVRLVKRPDHVRCAIGSLTLPPTHIPPWPTSLEWRHDGA